MDFAKLGLDLGIIGAIIAATKILTLVIDPQKKLERWYPLLPVLIGAAITIPLFWRDGTLVIIVKAFVYGFGAGHIYKTGKSIILGD
jgi:uncharacterized membrane protein YeaQ/YmgE (transglycosylase-associated protein family)